MVSHLLLLFPLLLSFLPAGTSDDRTALLLLSSAVRGSNLLWNHSDPTPCSWKGVTCDPTTNRVTSLRLPAKRLSGQLPPNSIGNLTHLRFLSLRHNSLSGSLPSDLSSCTDLTTLVLKDNQFSGQIPATLFSLNNLVRIDLSSNNFSGQILPEFNNLAELKTLHLESNQFVGSIPELNSLLKLTEFNASFNRLTGSIPCSLAKFSPMSFVGISLSNCPNEEGNKLSGGAIAGITIGSVIALLLILSVCFILWKRHTIARTSRRGVKMTPLPRSPEKPLQFESRDPVIVIERDINLSSNDFPVRPRVVKVIKSNGNNGLVIFGEGGVGDSSIEDLLKASAEVLGKGTSGTTYKAYLDGGSEAIVKRLRNVCVSEGEFRERIEGMGVVVHENLVPPRAYFYNRDEQLLVYDSMPMVSLFSLLHGTGGTHRSSLTWDFRSKIASEAALGIEYLHSFVPNLTHGNIKSSNILLTDQNCACISEFGITQLLSSSIAKLNGYRAPEVVDTRKISQKADVYSFGILLLELLTGKEPTSALEEEGVDLARWVQSVVEEKWTIDVFDSELLRYQNMEEQMVQLLHLAISCTSQDPERRPPMMKVTRQLKRICGLNTSLA